MRFKFRFVHLILASLWVGASVLFLDTQASAQGKAQIAIGRCEGAKCDIFIMDTDGENLRQLTFEPTSDNAPVWSPDGSRILFHGLHTVGVRAYNILVVEVETGSVEKLTDFRAPPLGPFEKPPWNYTGGIEPAWSPRGNQLAFAYKSGLDNLHSEIYVMDANGYNERLLTTPPHSDHSPSWSPDGRHIAFHSTRDKNTDIYIMDADGRNVRRLTNHPDTDLYPAWSPDGTQIAFTSYPKEKREGDIYIIDVDGQNRRNLTNHPAKDQNPAWSPDSTQIVFESDREGKVGFNFGIYVMTVEGENVRRLTEGFNPAWFDPAFALSVSPKLKSATTWGEIKQSAK